MERQRAENWISQFIPEGLSFRFVGDSNGFFKWMIVSFSEDITTLNSGCTQNAILL
jgi:hypothetical protein